MAWPTNTAAIIGALNSLHGRPSQIFEYAKTVLNTELIPVLDGLTFLPPERYPKGVWYYGEDLHGVANAELWPKMLVGGALTAQPYSVGNSISHVAALSISAVFPGLYLDSRQFLESLDLATIAMSIMFTPPYSGAFRDPDDTTKFVWNMTPPSGFSVIAPRADNPVIGWTTHLDVTQALGLNLWPVKDVTP